MLHDHVVEYLGIHAQGVPGDFLVQSAVEAADINPAFEQISYLAQDFGCGGAVLEGAGIGADGGVERISYRGGHFHAQGLDEFEDDAATGGGGALYDVDVAVAGVGAVVVDVDDAGMGSEALRRYVAQALPITGVHADEHLRQLGPGLRQGANGIRPGQEGIAARHAVFIPQRDLFAHSSQSQPQCQRGADGIAIRPEVGDDTKTFVCVDGGDEVLVHTICCAPYTMLARARQAIMGRMSCLSGDFVSFNLPGPFDNLGNVAAFFFRWTVQQRLCILRLWNLNNVSPIGPAKKECGYG